MRLFSAIYNKVMIWSQHRHAPYYLCSLSFAESIIFLVPPDLMLAPMVLAKFERAWEYATLTTVASVLGAILGYFIGACAFDLVHPLLIHLGYETTYQHIATWFGHWGFWVMLFAGFAPMPYNLFTIAAGATHIALLPFLLGSLIGRGGRFFLVTLLMLWGGERMKDMLVRYIDRIGWIVVIAIVLIYCVWNSRVLQHL
jgi:membrane protein YqaA with SNARE-associated domain